MNRRTASAPALYLRILVAWLLAMQPMIGAYAAAAASPLAGELCSGVSAPDTEPTGTADGHASCCLAACTPAMLPPPALPDAATPPEAHSEKPNPLRQTAEVDPAGFGPQSARAPPADLS